MIAYVEKYLEIYPGVSSTSLEKWLLDTPASRRSLRVHKQASVRSFAEYLFKMRVIEGDEYERIRKLYPRKNKKYKPKVKVIDEGQLRDVLDYSRTEMKNKLTYVSTLVLSETGLRIRELHQLRYHHLHFSEDPTKAYIYVEFGKGSKTRMVPFSKRAQQCVREHGLLWVKHSIDWMSHQYTKLSKRMEMEFNAHSFRHYRATLWANNPKIPIHLSLIHI